MKHITGSWQDAQGNRAANGELHLKLNQDAVIPATSQNAPREVSFQLDQTGSLPSSSQIWCNDELMPSTTYYILTVTDVSGGLIWGPNNMEIEGADPINLNASVPLPGIAGIDTTPAQTVVFTRPPLAAGVINARVSDIGTWSSNAYVTVSDQFVLAGSGCSIVASKSLDSLTASVVVSIDADAFSFPVFSAAALGVTATNQILLAGGSNVTLATATNPAGMTVSVNAASGASGGAVSIVAGPNITVGSTTNVAGSSFTITGASGGGPGGAGGAAGIANVGPGSIVGAAPGGSTLITNTMILVPANNITFYTNTDATNMSVFVSASSAQMAKVAMVPAGGSVIGATGPIQPNGWSFQAGPNITLSGQTDILSNLNLMISGNSGGGAGGAFTAGVSSGGLGSISAGYSSGTVTNQFLLVPGNNITMAPGTDPNGMTVSIVGAAPPTQVGLALPIGANSTIGSTAGFTDALRMSILRLVAGSNILLSIGSSTNAAGSTIASITINNLTNFAAGIAGQTVSNQLLLAAGSNVALATNTDINGMTITINASATGGAGGSFYAGISGGNTSGQTAIVNNNLMLAGGNNVTLSGSTNASGLTVTISGQNINMAVLTAGGGTATGTANVALNSLRLAPGTNILLSQSGQSVTINVSGLATFLGGISGGNTAGTTGTVSNQLVLAGGPNITLSGSTNASGMTVSISGTSGGGAGAGFSAGMSGGGVGSMLGTGWITPSGVGVSNVLRLVAGSNITLSGLTGSVTTGINSGQALTITINAGGGTYLQAGISGGNTSGITGTVSNQLVFAGGNNITLSGSTDVNGMTATISAAAGGGVSLITGGAGSITGASNALLGTLGLAAGSNVTLSQSSVSITINAAAGGAFSAGISTGGNTTGTTGTVSNQLVLAAGNNAITLSGSTNASGMTASILGTMPSFQVITGGAGSVSNTGNVVMSSLRIAAGSNVTISQSGQTITINAGSVAAAADNRYLANAWPIMPSYTSVTDWQLFGVAPIFWPFHPHVQNALLSSANCFFFFNQPGAGTAYGSLNVSLGIYTRTGSTLSQMSSGSNTYRWTLSHGVNDTLYGNMKLIKIPIVGGMSFDARDYWAGFVLGTTSSSQSFGLSVLGVQMRSGDMAGEFGVATAASWQQVPGWGLYTTGSTLPASLGFSDLEGTAATDQRAPLVYLAGFTA